MLIGYRTSLLPFMCSLLTTINLNDSTLLTSHVAVVIGRYAGNQVPCACRPPQRTVLGKTTQASFTDCCLLMLRRPSTWWRHQQLVTLTRTHEVPRPNAHLSALPHYMHACVRAFILRRMRYGRLDARRVHAPGYRARRCPHCSAVGGDGTVHTLAYPALWRELNKMFPVAGPLSALHCVCVAFHVRSLAMFLVLLTIRKMCPPMALWFVWLTLLLILQCGALWPNSVYNDNATRPLLAYWI